jgi:hypothetical protein
MRRANLSVPAQVQPSGTGAWRVNAPGHDADLLAVVDDDYFARAPAVTAAQTSPGQPVEPSLAGPPIAPSSYSPSGRLGFMNSIRVGFQLLPVCWSVLVQQPSLLVVPLVVLAASALSILGYAHAFGGVANLLGTSKYSAAIKVFPIDVVVMVMSVVGQAVIVAAATNTLAGRRASVGAAWLTAVSQLPRLAWFGVVYAAERTITSLLRGRRWSVGTLAANTIDRAWDFATFLAIPVLLYEDLPVFRAVARSGKLVAKRWGVQLTARSVLGFALFVVSFPLIVVGIALLTVSTVLGTVVLVVVLLGMFVMSGALTGVLSAALYRFATTGLVAPGFDEADMWAVFSRR